MIKTIKCLEDSSHFQIKLGGKDSIDAESFNQIIQNTVSLLKESAEITIPHAFLRVEINGNAKGSFLTYLSIIINDNQTLINCGKEIVGAGTSILGLIYTWLKIKQHLKGQKEKEIDSSPKNHVVIINQGNETLEVSATSSDHYFKNNRIDHFVSSLFQEARKEGRTYFELIPGKESKLKPLIINNTEFDTMGKAIIDFNEPITHIVQLPATVNLLVKHACYIGDSQWGFINDKVFKATIKDKVFLKKFQNGQIVVGPGCQLKCSLQVEFDLINMREIKKDSERYTVLEVFEVIQPKQQELF